MNNKEKHEFYKENLKDIYKRTAEEVVQELVNILIDALYIPKESHESITQVDPIRIKHFGIDDNEPINWGDLSCNDVKKFEDGSYLVVIDEAAPNDCQTFCEYIEKYMRSYGWEVKIETEW